MSEDRKLWNNPHGQTQRPLTAARRATFLRVLRDSGNYQAAARAASPHAKPGKSCGASSSFRALENRDPNFKAAVTEAIEDAKAAVEMEIKRRAQDGWLEPVYQKGERVFDVGPDGKAVPATIRRYSDNLLLARARALMPEKYSEKRQLEISGTVAHVGCMITPQDIAMLSPQQQTALADVLRTLAIARGESDEDELPMIDVTPEPPKPAEPVKLGRAGFVSKRPPSRKRKHQRESVVAADVAGSSDHLHAPSSTPALDPAEPRPTLVAASEVEPWELME